MIIRRVGALSCAKIAGAIYAMLGVLFGLVLTLVSLASPAVAPGANDTAFPFFPGLFGVAAVAVLPLFYGCMGFVMTLIMAGLYNLLAGILGGIEIDITQAGGERV